MIDEDTLSREDIEQMVKLKNSFPTFLDSIGSTCDRHIALSLEINGGFDNHACIDATNADCVYAWIAWQLSFTSNIRPLWLVPDWRLQSPVERLVAIIQKLGKLAFPIDEHNNRKLNIRQLGSGLDVSSIHPMAGCGASPVHLVIEGCEYQSEEWTEIVRNISPSLYGATKGKGSIVTIQPPILN